MHQLTHYGKLILCDKLLGVQSCKLGQTVLWISGKGRAVTCHGPELCKYNKGDCESVLGDGGMLTHFSLFSGIGGIDLSAEWAGFTTVGQCEFADYPTKVLEKHWPNVPRWRDVRDVTAESIRERGISNITLLSGGFPCQPFSTAGKRGGKEDDRYLWPEMVRVIAELGPAWVLGENVAGIISLALDQVLSDLEGIDYACQAFVIPACGVDAPHRRRRVFFVAHSRSGGLCESDICKEQQGRAEAVCSSQNVDYSDSEGFSAQWISGGIQQAQGETRSSTQRGSMLGREWNSKGWQPEPELGRVANGIPNRAHRLKCLGNAVVPQQVYPILQAIADIERGLTNDLA